VTADKTQDLAGADLPQSTRIKPVDFQPRGKESPGLRAGLSPRAAVIFLLLTACLGFAWYTLTARAVQIKTTPEPAAVAISGGLHFRLADRYLLRQGTYKLEINAKGYAPLKQELTVDDRQYQDYAFELMRLPGHLNITTPAVNGAEIYIDEIYRGTTPALVNDISHGEHQLSIHADRYFTHVEKVMVAGLDQEQSLTINLDPAWADVHFATRPPGADVFINEEILGQTPVTAEVLEGSQTVRIKLNGYKVWQDDIRVIAGNTMNLDDIELVPADAVVFLVSNPPRANTTVDGEYMGLTPLELALTPGKTSTIRLYKQGYMPASRKITAASGDQLRMDMNLEPELVEVLFNISPGDARLYIDGKAVEAGQQSLQLPAREHHIEIKKAGYVDYAAHITPHSGVTQQVNVNLKTLQQARVEQIKPVITSSAGQTLKLFYPAPFTMGASRREPGRRANETLHEVELKRPFYLGLHEITNAQYRMFNKDHSSGSFQGTSLNGDQQPVVNVTWEQAALYCNWLSTNESLPLFYREKNNRITGINRTANGYRLPSEAEWEWAARATEDGAQHLKFAWGQQMPPAEKSGNYADRSVAALLGKIIDNYNDGYLASAPVGSFPAGNNGLFDMGGNVAEWVNDFYDIVPPGNSLGTDPLGPENGELHIIKGSSWAHGTITELRLSYRDYGDKQRDDTGFRIARYLD
jgi:formylglycine-generating enzyme required for sulfatase activity